MSLIDKLSTIDNNTITLDYYPQLFGSCGFGAFVLSEEKELIQVPRQLFSKFSPVKQYSVINAIGESMQPYICSKDKLIVEHWQGEQIKDNQIYVFCYHNEIFVKRLIKNIDEIVVKSDNPDPAYRTRFIEKDDILKLWGNDCVFKFMHSDKPQKARTYLKSKRGYLYQIA